VVTQARPKTGKAKLKSNEIKIFGKKATRLLSICLHIHNMQPLMARKFIEKIDASFRDIILIKY
jgi:hypothetical protein